MKNFFAMIPHDVKRTLLSLAVSVALICGSLFMLSAFLGDVTDPDPDAQVLATASPEESAEELSP